MRHRFVGRNSGFSLVEVVLALGIVSFCMVSVVGLLPVGLSSVKNGTDESAASTAFLRVASAIRGATNTNGAYVANGSFSNITWSLNGATTTNLISLSSNGDITTTDPKFRAFIEMVAPDGNGGPGHARLSVAWPAQAQWQNGAWTNAQGSVSSAIIFLSQQ